MSKRYGMPQVPHYPVIAVKTKTPSAKFRQEGPRLQERRLGGRLSFDSF
jgi:hypothetical protein